MSFTKKTAKEAGKRSNRKGVPNKTTKEIRELFKTLLEANIEKIQRDLNKMDPQQRVKIILEIAKFVIPTLRSSEIKAEVDLKMNYKPIWGTVDPVLDNKSNK
ncbi:MAG TPA: hypothetical protein VIO43_12235 [Lutibacter sp.]